MMNGPGSVRSVSMLLARAVADDGDRPAVTDEHGTVTFRDLAARVARDAATLAAAGVGAGDRVAVVLPNSTAFVQTTLATLACGAAVFPVNAAARPPELRRLLATTPVAALVGRDPTHGACAPTEAAVLTGAAAGLTTHRARTGAHAAPATPQPGTTALAAYSSGTIGRPHLVERSHENLWWEAENFHNAIRLDGDDVVLAVVPLSHAHGFGNALMASLRAGARLVVCDRFLRGRTLDVLQQERVTVFPTVPFMLRMLTTADRRRRWDLGALRWCISAGAPLTREIFDGFRGRFGVTIRQLYGLTEAGSVTLCTAPEATLDPTCAGTPLGTTRVTVADEAGNALPPDREGEVVVYSDAAPGGAGAPLRTHDRGRRAPDGALWITGRTSLFINSAGNKVDPAEVEAVLLRHPAVGEAAVFGAPTAQGEEIVTAVVVLRAPCPSAILRAHCRAALASYKVPREIRVRATLPRSPLGKVRIGQLLAQVAPSRQR
jgi:long-chain acyl-CoA synthetase